MKKFLIGTGVMLVGLAGALTSFGAGTYITLASSTASDLFAYAGALFNDLWVLVAIAIGVPLAFYIIKKVIALIPKR